MTEKLNLNLGEIVVMHERADMAEQAREKIRFAMSLLLDEFEQVLQDFDSCTEIDDEKRNKLKAIYKKMLGKLFCVNIALIMLNICSQTVMNVQLNVYFMIYLI